MVSLVYPLAQAAMMDNRNRSYISKLAIPPRNVNYLGDFRQLIEGYETFNPIVEVLKMLKGGFGLKDAPRLWTNKVDKTFCEHRLLPTHGDPI